MLYCPLTLRFLIIPLFTRLNLCAMVHLSEFTFIIFYFRVFHAVID